MGFYSWNCSACEESIKAPYDLPSDISWQNKVHAIMPGGLELRGEYDGYGRVSAYQLDDTVQVWHQRCYDKAGEQKYSQPSKWSDDQGYFYDRPESMEQK
jgi:hypothetical protein